MSSHPDTAAGAASSTRLLRSLLQFEGDVNGPGVERVLKAVTYMYLGLPVYALALALLWRHIRSEPDLFLALAAMALFVAINVFDFWHLQHGAMGEFTPLKALCEVWLATGTFALFGAAFGTHEGAFLLLPCLPFLVTALMGKPVMVAGGWLGLFAALVVETTAQAPASQALPVAVLFAVGAGVAALMINEVVRGTIRDGHVSRSLAELAAHASTLREWPDGLLTVAATLATAMEVDRFAVCIRSAPGASLEQVFAWPEADWVLSRPAGDVRELALTALAKGEPLHDETHYATPAFSAAAGLVVLCPFRGRTGSPVDTTIATTVARLLALMFDRSRVIAGLIDLAHTDELTGLPNRRRLFEVLHREASRAKRSGRAFSITMLDLDNFKSYNDRFGHAAGDHLLRLFAERTVSRLRGQDLIARYGGEEFCLVLPETDAAGAATLVEALRRVGAGVDPLGERVTFSAGIATWDMEESIDDLVLRADTSLYAAKETGRDRIVSLT
ncbi:MAG TPA: GGDEF domain-containing protein [Acidimicrobiales bacterium]|nr:GGDEF domain-containing protein [Acidimicrobiales bacterium]